MSAIPLAYAQNQDAQGAIDEALNALRASVHRFETAASQLLDQAKDDVENHKLLCAYVDACKQMSTGNLAWRFVVLSCWSLDLLTVVSVCGREDMGFLVDRRTTAASR